MSSNTVRLFKVNDDKVITLAGVARSHYMKYKEYFTDFNPTIFFEEYEHTTLAAAITSAQDTLSDSFYVKRQMKETDGMQKAMKLLKRELKKLSFCVLDQFRNVPGVLEEFKLNGFASKYRKADLLIGFTKDVLMTIDKYKADLQKSGLTDEEIAKIEQRCENLDRQRREQIEVINARPRLTQDRIEKMNALWLELVKINMAAEFIFDDNPEIQKLFALPKYVKRRRSVVAEETLEEVAV